MAARFKLFDALLQFSLALTGNGQDAIVLLRDAMAEAYRSGNESIPEGSSKTGMCNILNQWLFNDFRRQAGWLDSDSGDNVDGNPVRNERLFPAAEFVAHQNSFRTDDREKDTRYFQTIAGLPALFRSAMILSYLEEFSIKEIADLAGIQPQAVESLLNRGRELLQEELFSYMIGNNNFDTTTDRTAASG